MILSTSHVAAAHHSDITHPVLGALQVSSDLCINAIADSKDFGGLIRVEDSAST